MQIIGDVEIQIAVGIHISPGAARSKSFVVEYRLIRNFRPRSVAVIFVEMIGAIAGYIQILKPIIVVVADGCSHGVIEVPQACQSCDVFKDTISISEELIAMFWLFRLHRRECCALTKIEIRPVVAIMVNPRQTRSHEQVQMSLGRQRGVILEINFDVNSDVGEPWLGILCEGRATNQEAAKQNRLHGHPPDVTAEQ